MTEKEIASSCRHPDFDGKPGTACPDCGAVARPDGTIAVVPDASVIARQLRISLDRAKGRFATLSPDHRPYSEPLEQADWHRLERASAAENRVTGEIMALESFVRWLDA